MEGGYSSPCKSLLHYTACLFWVTTTQSQLSEWGKVSFFLSFFLCKSFLPSMLEPAHTEKSLGNLLLQCVCYACAAKSLLEDGHLQFHAQLQQAYILELKI
jgi:hypothetical protein